MKKILGITFGGLQKKTVALVLMVLFLTISLLSIVSFYQNQMLVGLVEDTQTEQQESISTSSEKTMSKMLGESLVAATNLQAGIADNDFSEVINNVSMLQSMAQGLFKNKDSLSPVKFGLPDPAKNGSYSAMVLHEEGVDYTKSQYLGIIAHMSDPMIALAENSEKISGCYIGLADGTHLGIDSNTSNKYDEEGNLIPFPVRQRPWYKGAIEKDGIYFTGLEKDAFTGDPGITCSIPIKVDGKVIGVAGIDIVLENMHDFVNASADNEGTVFIVNNKGQVVLSSDNSLFPDGEISDQTADLRQNSNKDFGSFIEESLKETTGLKLIKIKDKSYYMVGSPMPTVGWAVISAIDKEITEQPEKQLLADYDKINEKASSRFKAGSARTMHNSLLVLGLIILLAAVAALIAAHRIVKPIEDITKDINECGQTGKLFQMKEAYRTNDEIEILAEAFDDLSKKTKKYIQDITEITREKERVSTELQMANRIQTSMLPGVFPPYPDRSEFDIFASMEPAREVGGDFYDFFLIDEDHLCMVMADVSGKGVPAALFMMISKVILQSCAMLGQGAGEILVKTNEAICSSNQVDMFVTVWLGILEISTGKITAANAGHEYPALMKNGRFSLLKDKHSLVIGGMDGIKYREYEIVLEAGDKLFLYTDGIPEASDTDHNMFGTERMIDALNEDASASPRHILQNVRKAVDVFTKGAEQFDDMTMMCIQYKGCDK